LIAVASTATHTKRAGGSVNLTFAMHAESRFNEAVFTELHALLTAPGGAGAGIVVQQMHRAPGPANSEFAVALEVESAGRPWTTEFAISEWKDLPDRSPTAMARWLAEEIRALLASGPPDEPEDSGRRRLFRRR
jgi:hypothetical protein